MKWIAVILIAIVVSACGGAQQVQSNVTVGEYVIKERVVRDTVPVMRDTTSYRETVRIEIRYIKNEVGVVDRVYLKADCPPSKLKVVTQTVTIEKRQRVPWWTVIIWPIAFIVAIAILVKRLLN